MAKLEGPPDALSVRRVELPPEELQKLVDEAIKEIDRAISDRSQMEKQWAISRDQYNSRLKRPDAVPPDANLDMTLTREFCQQTRARLLNPIFQQDRLFISTPRKPNLNEIAKTYEDLLDFVCDKARLLTLADDWVEMAQIYHHGVIKIPWSQEQRKVTEWVTQQVPVVDPMTGQPMIQAAPGPNGMPVPVPVTQPQMVENERWVTERVGAFPETVPIDDFIFPAGARDIRSSPWIDHRLCLSKGEMGLRIRRGVYYNVKPEELGEPVAKRSEFAIQDNKTSGLDVSESKLFEVHEVYMSKDVDGDGEDEEIILSLERGSRKALRCVYNFYHDYPRPFVVWRFKKRQDGIPGVSQCQLLESLHRAYSASINQRLDTASKANEVIAIGRTGSGLDKFFRKGKLKGGYYEIPGDPKSDIVSFNLSQPFTQLKELEGVLEQRAQKLVGITDYNYGIEQISRPTASGQVQLIQEGQQPLFILLESFREAFAEMAKMMLARYRQFFPSGLEVYTTVETPQGQQFLSQFVAWPEGSLDEQVYVETKVSSATMNRQLRKQEAFAWLDKSQAIYQTLMGLYGAAVQPAPIAPIAAKLGQGYQAFLGECLSLSEVPNAEIVNPDLTQEVQLGMVMAIQQMQQMQLMQQQQTLASLSGDGGPGPGGAGSAQGKSGGEGAKKNPGPQKG